MKTVLIILALAWTAGYGQSREKLDIPLRPGGIIPVWYVTGPFEQRTTGFGVFQDADPIGEENADPFDGKREQSPWVQSATVSWQAQAVDEKGYLDLNQSLGWAIPESVLEKVWIAKAGYAFARLESPEEREAFLLVGSNCQLRVFLNGTRVYAFSGERGALPDQDTIRITLHRGTNRLLLKVGNTHQNYWMHFFGGAPWGWGAYARVTDAAKRPLNDLRVSLDRPRQDPGMELMSTFFFKQSPRGLLQRYDLIVHSPWAESRNGTFRIHMGQKEEQFELRDVRYGDNRIPLFVPATQREQAVQCSLEFGGKEFSAVETLRVEKHYELHLMLLTHTDIGYTHPQPVVKELHAMTLDDVLTMCRKYPDFRWTIETVWQLQQFEQSRPKTLVDELAKYIREGRIAVSPIYTNPFTGWVSEEEMIRSLYPAREYAARWGLTYPGAVYNDVPGLAWFMPEVFQSAGVLLVACGINEVYGGYTLQQSLPKAFTWEGPDSSRVVVYLTETYNEGSRFGLERDEDAIEHRTWERIKKLEAAHYNCEMILVNAGWMDNGGVAKNQYGTAERWNKIYSYPRFVFTNVSAFARDFTRRYGKSLPVLRGDWTSAWDIQFQGEPARVIRERWTQQQILTAEKFDAVNSLRDPRLLPFRDAITQVYRSLLHFSGHGSGLEYGYGTPTENALTMDFREQYVRDAMLGTEDVLARTMTRLIRPEESFEGEGVIVCNPLSWSCDVPLDVEAKDSSGVQFAVADMATGRPVPSYREGNHLFLIASSVPSFGFKKFALREMTGPVPGTGELQMTQTAIENQYYRITVDPASHRVVSIRDKELDREIVGAGAGPFDEPLRQTPFIGGKYEVVAGGSSSVAVIDQRPVRVILSISRPGHLFERTEYILWNNLKRVDIQHEVNLERLQPPPTAEVYALGFPFALHSPEGRPEIRPEIRIEGLGGFQTVPRDKLPGALSDAFSVRHCVSLSDGELSVAWCSRDSRVVFWQSDSNGRSPMLLANVVNNFPLQWNRHEENKGRWMFRFSFQTYKGRFDAERTARLGWETQTEFPNKKTWLRHAPAETSFVSVRGSDVILTAMKRAEADSGVILRLMNVNPEKSASASVSSILFAGMNGFEATVFEEKRAPVRVKDGVLRVNLRPSETKTLLLEPNVRK